MFDRNDPSRIINFRPLLFAAVGLIAGIACFEAWFGLNVGNTASTIIIVLAAALSGGLCIWAIINRRIELLVIFAAFLLGLARAASAVTPEIPEREYSVAGIVESVSGKEGRTFVLRNVELDGRPAGTKLKLTLKSEDASPWIGTSIGFRAVVKMPSVRFGSYDERTVLLGSGVGIKATAESYDELARDTLPLLQFVHRIRAMLSSRIEAIFGRNAQIVSGFLLGDSSGIDEADMESFRATGTAHLLTLSGFHVALITALMFYLLPKRFPWLRFAIVGFVLIIYCAIAAFAPSIVRASVMCGCILLSEVTERRRDPLSALSLSLILILLISPYKLYSVGFRLSFAATYGIIIMTSAGAVKRGGVIGKLVSTLLVTLGATAATALISASCFGVFPTYGLIANVVAVPVFSAAITISFVLLVIGIPLPGVAAFFAWLPNTLIDAAMFILNRIEALPYAQIEVFSPSILSGLLMLTLMFSISGFVLRPPKWKLRTSGLILLLFTASIFADIIRA